MRFLRLDGSGVARSAIDSGRWRRHALCSLVLLCALGGGLLGLGHHHDDGGLTDDDHCVACYAQQSLLLPDPILETTSLEAPRIGALQTDLAVPGSTTGRLGPPRRGPPTA